MTSLPLGRMKPKTPTEILAKLRETIHRHRKKFVKKHSVCHPENCAGAVLDAEGNPQPCTLCGAKQGEECKRDTAFMPRHSREAIHALFKADINNPQKLVRDYRDVAFLLWALGLLDGDKLVGPTPTNVAEGSRPEGDDPISTGPQIVWVELPQNVSRESFEVFVNAAMRMVAESADHTPHD